MTGDWGGYRAIFEEAWELAEQERRNPPAVCPIDGELLVYNQRRREWGCPLGNYRTREPLAPREG